MSGPEGEGDSDQTDNFEQRTPLNPSRPPHPPATPPPPSPCPLVCPLGIFVCVCVTGGEIGYHAKRAHCGGGTGLAIRFVDGVNVVALKASCEATSERQGQEITGLRGEISRLRAQLQAAINSLTLAPSGAPIGAPTANPSTTPTAAPTVVFRTLVRYGYTLFRLQGAVIPAGDAKTWYQGLCAAYGLRPVACHDTWGTMPGTYNAVQLPVHPFSCGVNRYITQESGWPNTITFYHSDMDRGSGLAGLPGAFSAGTTGFPICVNVTSVAGLPTLVRAGRTLYRLPQAVIPAGDAKAWYQGLCAAYNLRPVACHFSHGTLPGTYNAVALSTTFSCHLASYITPQTGWTNIITFYQGNMHSGTGLDSGNGVYLEGATGYPICTNF